MDYSLPCDRRTYKAHGLRPARVRGEVDVLGGEEVVERDRKAEADVGRAPKRSHTEVVEALHCNYLADYKQRIERCGGVAVHLCVCVSEWQLR